MRLVFLDSIRGIGSFCVLISHVFLCFLFAADPLLWEISRHLIIFDGTFAVHIFFVLSGMSLSIAYLAAPRPHTNHAQSMSQRFDYDSGLTQLKRMIAQRYFRLALPIAVSSIFIAFLLNMGLIKNNELSNIFANKWIKYFYHIDSISFKDWFSFSFYDAVLLHGDDVSWLNKSLNAVLWTMPIEFFGSMLVFLLIFLLKGNQKRWVVYGLLVAYFFCIQELYAAFCSWSRYF